MRPVTVSTTGVTTSAVVPLCIYTNASKVALGVKVSGSCTYTIQHTFDDIFASGYDPSTGTWYSYDQPNLVGATTNQDGNYNDIPRACRINQTAGAGTTTLTVIQNGIV